MKYQVLIFLSFFVVTLCFAQEEINPNGYNKIYYPNGNIQSEGNLKNGKPEGFWINYYPTGVIKSKGTRRNHLLDSVWVFYNISGDIISQIGYLEGNKNGYCYSYYTKTLNPVNKGNLKTKELYVNSRLEGKVENYYESGKIHEIIEYSDNKKEGTGIVFAEDGRIVTIYNYRKGTITSREKINRYTSDNLKTGLWKEFYEGLNTKKEVYYKNGLLDGYYKEYSIQGKLLLTHLYRNGELVEIVEEDKIESQEKISHYDNGNLKSKGSFKSNKPIGIHKEYSIEGEIVVAKVYNDFSELVASGKVDKNGKKIDKWKEFYPDGKIKARGNFVNNRREGKWEFLFENGKTEQVGEFVKGKYSGNWKWYYKNGNLWKEEEFYNNINEGYYIEYDLEGNIIVEGDYYDGEKEGEWIVRINDHKAIGKYVTGLMDGRWKHYYDDGNLSYEGSYIQGSADGKHKYFYSNGNIKEEQFYSMGMRQKHWKKFDINGQLIITISYKDDKEYRINGVKVDFPMDIPKVIR